MNKTTILPVLAAVAFSLASHSEANEAPSDGEILDQAEAFFRQAKDAALTDPAAARELYRRSAQRFELLANDRGFENPELLTNLGNAAYLSGDLGQALYAYRRAELLPEASDEVAKSIAHVRSERIDRIEPPMPGMFSRIGGWFAGWPIWLAAWLVIVAWTVACWCLYRLLRMGNSSRQKWIGPLMGCVALALVASCICHRIDQRRFAGFGIIIAESVTARRGDGLIYDPAFSSLLHPATEFRLLEIRKGWIHAEFADGMRGWIEQNDAAIWPRSFGT